MLLQRSEPCALVLVSVTATALMNSPWKQKALILHARAVRRRAQGFDFFRAGARCTHTVSLAERVEIRCSAGQEMASTGTTPACCVRKVMRSDTAWSHSNWIRAFVSRTVRRILRRRFESVNSALSFTDLTTAASTTVRMLVALWCDPVGDWLIARELIAKLHLWKCL